MNKVLFLTTMAVIGIMALLVGGQFFYFLFFLMSIMLVYAYISVTRASKQLVGLFWLDKYNVVRDSTIKVDVKLYNSSLLPISYMEIDYNIPERLNREKLSEDVLNMNPFESVKLDREIKCKRRGVYNLGKIKVRISDVFGLVSKTTNVTDNVVLKVYPKIHELKSFQIAEKESYGKIKSNSGYEEDYSSIKDIKKYNIGDSPKRINWKVSAKRGYLYIKNYDIYNNVKVKIYVDFEEDKYKDDIEGVIEEKIIECSMSISKYMLARNIPVDLITYTDNRISIYGKNLSSLEDFLELMTTVRPINNVSIKDIIDNEKNFLLLSDTMVIITPLVDEKVLTSVISLKKRGYSLCVISICDFMRTHQWHISNLETLERLGIQIFKLGTNDDINRVLR